MNCNYRKGFSDRLILKALIGKKGINKKISGRSVLTILLIASMLVTVSVFGIVTLKNMQQAMADLTCDHVHDEECYIAPDGHECSVEDACEPVYPMISVVVSDAHFHTDECYALAGGHTHDEGCLDEEDSAVCEMYEGEGCVTDFDSLVCGVEEGIITMQDIPDTDATPIGWICGVERAVVCEHRECTPEHCIAFSVGNLPDPAPIALIVEVDARTGEELFIPDSGMEANVGDVFEFTIMLKNIGEEELFGIIVMDNRQGIGDTIDLGAGEEAIFTEYYTVTTDDVRAGFLYYCATAAAENVKTGEGGIMIPVKSPKNLDFTVMFIRNYVSDDFEDREIVYDLRDVAYPAMSLDDVDERMPLNPSQEGYTFLGWNTEKGGDGLIFTVETTIADMPFDPDTGIVKIWAQWAPYSPPGNSAIPGALLLDKTAKRVIGTAEGVYEWDIELSLRGMDIAGGTDVVLMIDSSTSMCCHDMKAAKAAAKAFVDALIPVSGQGASRVAIIDFASNVNTRGNFSNVKSELDTAIGRIPSDGKGGTNMQGALVLAQHLFKNYSSARNRQIVILGDGKPSHSLRATTAIYNGCIDKVKEQDVNNAALKLTFMVPQITTNAHGLPALTIEKNSYNASISTGNGSSYESGVVGIKATCMYCGKSHTYPKNNGIATIYEAKMAKEDGIIIHAVAIDAGSKGATVMKECASSSQSYKSIEKAKEIHKLDGMLKEIADTVCSAANDAVVYDPIGDRFDLVSGITTSLGNATFDGAKGLRGEILWDIDEIKESHGVITMKYRLRLDVVGANQLDLFPTNGRTFVHFVDAVGNEQYKDFPIPYVGFPGIGSVTRRIYIVDDEGRAVTEQGVPTTDRGKIDIFLIERVENPKTVSGNKYVFSLNVEHEIRAEQYKVVGGQLYEFVPGDSKNLGDGERMKVTLTDDNPTRAMYYAYRKIDAIPAPELKVEKTAKLNGKAFEAGMYAKAGDVIEYTITVINTGNTILKNINVVDGMIGIDEIIELGVGERRSFTGRYDVTVDDAKAGFVLNVASAADDKGTDGEDEIRIPVGTPNLRLVPTEINYGVGMLPMKRTVYGLSGSTVCTEQVEYVINRDADAVSELGFEVQYPDSAPWRIELQCTPFMANGKPRAMPVAVGRAGNILSGAFAENTAVLIYSSDDFTGDVDNGAAKVEGDAGTWSWDRLKYDVKVEARPGGHITTETYQSVLTWSFIIAP